MNAAIVGAFLLLGALGRRARSVEPPIERLPSIALVSAPVARREPPAASGSSLPSPPAPPAHRAPALSRRVPRPSPPTRASLPDAPSPPTRAVVPVPIPIAGSPVAPALPPGAPDGAPAQAKRGRRRLPETVRPPAEISVPPPVYPRILRRRGVEGRVLVRLRVGVDGRVARCEVLRVEGSRRFERAVRDALPRWRFRPAIRRGRRVPAWVVKSIRFELRPAR